MAAPAENRAAVPDTAVEVVQVGLVETCLAVNGPLGRAFRTRRSARRSAMSPVRW